MKENFDKSLSFTLRWEGGYVNDPHDPGGETKFGISKRAYPKVDIKNLTEEKAKEIYKKDYWDKVKGDDLPIGVDTMVFDAAVNSGVGASAKWLQACLGVTVDGDIGPKTLAAVAKTNHKDLILSLGDHRISFLRRLKTWSRFGAGWTNRVSDAIKFSIKSLGVK